MAYEIRVSTYCFFNSIGRLDVYERQPPPFRHNCLHDLESAWWIGLWMTYVFAPILPYKQDVDNFLELFPPPYIKATRPSGIAHLLIQSSLIKTRLAPEQNKLNFWRHACMAI